MILNYTINVVGRISTVRIFDSSLTEGTNDVYISQSTPVDAQLRLHCHLWIKRLQFVDKLQYRCGKHVVYCIILYHRITYQFQLANVCFKYFSVESGTKRYRMLLSKPIHVKPAERGQFSLLQCLQFTRILLDIYFTIVHFAQLLYVKVKY